MILLPNTLVLIPTLDSELDPPTRESIKQIAPNIWTICASVLCYAYFAHIHSKASPDEDSISKRSIVSWKDGSQTFYLVEREATSPPVPESGQGDSTTGRIYAAGSSSGVWSLGNEVIVKIKSWHPGQQAEPATIAFIRENVPSIALGDPTLFFRIEEESNRSIFVMPRVKGRTLDIAWPDLSQSQCSNIAKEIASYVVALAEITRPRYESVDGFGIKDMHHKAQPESEPSWKAHILGPFSIPDLRAYLKSVSNIEPLQFDDDEPFVLFHNDLCAANIIVQDDGAGIEAIIDWESVGFFPRYWVATNCMSFWLENKRLSDDERWDWARLLISVLVSKGFVDHRKEWSQAKYSNV